MNRIFALSVSLGLLLGVMDAARADAFRAPTTDNGGDGYLQSLPSTSFRIFGANDQDSEFLYDPAGYTQNATQFLPASRSDFLQEPQWSLAHGPATFNVAAGQASGLWADPQEGIGGRGKLSIANLQTRTDGLSTLGGLPTNTQAEGAPSPSPGSGYASFAAVMLALAVVRLRGLFL